jgi:hypothetical protein
VIRRKPLEWRRMRMHALAAFLLSVSNAVSAPFAVQVGEARIGLDAPPGFADTSFTGSPRLQELAESLTSASNRVLLFAVTDADLRRFTLGDQLELRRYMIAVTPRATERERMTPGAFTSFAAESLRDLGPMPSPGDHRKYLESRPAGTVNVLAELRKDPDAVAVLLGARSKPTRFFEASKYQLSSTSMLLLRGKPLTLSVYTQYDEPADLDWIRVTTARWIDELKRLNAR